MFVCLPLQIHIDTQLMSVDIDITIGLNYVLLYISSTFHFLTI